MSSGYWQQSSQRPKRHRHKNRYICKVWEQEDVDQLKLSSPHEDSNLSASAAINRGLLSALFHRGKQKHWLLPVGDRMERLHLLVAQGSIKNRQSRHVADERLAQLSPHDKTRANGKV